MPLRWTCRLLSVLALLAFAVTIAEAAEPPCRPLKTIGSVVR